MENEAVTLYCPNQDCLAANPLNHKFCQQCSAPLPKRYLWAVGDVLNMGSPGDVLGDRYLVIQNNILLDTKPGILPQMPDLGKLHGSSIEQIKVYLRLFPHRLNIPQIYGILPGYGAASDKPILLLEQPPLYSVDSPLQVQLYPQLTTAWHEASSMRQLNWLWQIAHLWQPFHSHGVASSLIDADVLRVTGPLVRLLDLRFDAHKSPGLRELGKFWQQLLPQSLPPVADFIREISNFLIEGRISSPDVLIAVLDQGLAQLGASQTLTVQMTTLTDTGPRRERNEDACYPPSGTVVTMPPQESALAIVCDGIGGHQGGNIASNLAIETIYQQLGEVTDLTLRLRSPTTEHPLEPSRILAILDDAVAVANDKISDRNDGEHRQARQRMGTTLVMALPVGHEMYLTHVGDSRAYWVTREGCYQVTLDDDVASRDVRLGYAVYREAVGNRGAGSLIQALGMSGSSSLHPTSQRFILDEEGIFLLTSDGLSDFDRVEDYWQTEILPILTGEDDIISVANKLVELANTKNGHDNVTLALIHYKVQCSDGLSGVATPDLTLKAVIPDISSVSPASSGTQELHPTLLEGSHNQKTQVISKIQSSGLAKLPLNLLVLLLLLVLAGLLGYWMMQLRSRSNIPTLETPPTPSNSQPGQRQ
ncbi:PP2C family protein-serine/threonine phosphatase [Anabaena sp. CS-542/02]|uniref:PP2C family protein-serine/threonine phosphatase n=1 Tax=Anabaena sp. CS-542/02 TaxID=3021719 RepID=UPI00232E844D|nr:PP2C family serine/threonine-protein phosphatase [Anabaena sp. CS-542/02]MDB9445151.1 serine/threonine-protein phosphatase [Anabaena sp. CS-542/02]